ncbi:hypothetical protein ACMD2_18796, partial [Ananas comosus]
DKHEGNGRGLYNGFAALPRAIPIQVGNNRSSSSLLLLAPASPTTPKPTEPKCERNPKVHKNKYEGYSVSLDGSKQIADNGIKNQSKRVKISDSSREERCSDLTMRHNSKQISLSRDRRAWFC